MPRSIIIRYLVAYGFAHALIDASCCYILFGVIDAGREILTYIILYNLLAFGLQAPLGFWSDYLGKPVLFAFLGCLLTCSAFFFYFDPLTVTLFAGIGNALFHVGGGTVALNLKPGKATMPGLFVAPGGLGLFAGGMLVKYHFYHVFILVSLLIIVGIVLLILKQPEILHEKKRINGNFVYVSIILLLIAVCMRSGVAFLIHFPWKSLMLPSTIFIAAVALGKGAGGYLSDRFGWIKITVGGLAASAFFLLFGHQYIFAGIVGIFLFNFSMPVTLTAISNLLPGRPGFSFGLTTLALLAGSIPTLIKKDTFITGGMQQISLLVILSAAILFIGLKLYYKSLQNL